MSRIAIMKFIYYNLLPDMIDTTELDRIKLAIVHTFLCNKIKYFRKCQFNQAIHFFHINAYLPFFN